MEDTGFSYLRVVGSFIVTKDNLGMRHSFRKIITNSVSTNRVKWYASNQIARKMQRDQSMSVITRYVR